MCTHERLEALHEHIPFALPAWYNAMTGQFSRKPMDVGFSQVPHGFWTIDVTPGARCLLGWLHSHTDQFLPYVTVNMIRREFRTSSAAKWLNELSRSGFVAIAKGGPGKTDSYELMTEPWIALHQRRRHRAELGSVAPASEPKPAHHRAETGSVTEPKLAHIEDQVEDHVEDQSSSSPPGLELVLVEIDEHTKAMANTAFEKFWKTYGNLAGTAKSKGRERWNKATENAAAEDIQAGLERWVTYWRTPGATKAQFAEGFLNNQRWTAEPPPITAQAGTDVMARARARRAQRQDQEQEQEHDQRRSNDGPQSPRGGTRRVR